MRKTATGRTLAWMLTTVMLLATVALLSVPCGDDDDDAAEETTTTTEAELSLSEFEGSWTASSYTVTANDDPTKTVDLVATGATLTGETDDAGNLAGTLTLPPPLGGPDPLTFDATFTLEDPETLTVAFDPEIPPLLTGFTGPFTLEADTLTLTDTSGTFDFGDGGGEVSVTTEAVFVRS
jgi:hypothetical protein